MDIQLLQADLARVEHTALGNWAPHACKLPYHLHVLSPLEGLLSPPARLRSPLTGLVIPLAGRAQRGPTLRFR